MRKKDVLLIEFLDPALHPEWTESPQHKEPVPCIAVGICVHKDKDKVVLAEVMNEWGHYAGVYAIPRRCITSTTKMKQGE